MNIKQYSVKVVPTQGIPFHIVVGGFTRTDAWSTAESMYPGASCMVLGEV
jgi:hypothetical protein